ncbi:MAG TPA: hypothetical protein P5114_04950 [Hyphomicrobiaceae bacterium]|nr:hypothetical protein [Hyphomicrobiaceae bacterium]
MVSTNDHTGTNAPQPTPQEAQRRRHMRSWAIAGALLFLVFAFYAATIIHLGGNALNRPL